jgi:hypothetical protein
MVSTNRERSRKCMLVQKDILGLYLWCWQNIDARRDGEGQGVAFI